MDNPIQPPILSFEAIKDIAEKFLTDYKGNNELPAPIERIIEFDLGINIIPFPGLQSAFEVEGFISGDLIFSSMSTK